MIRKRIFITINVAIIFMLVSNMTFAQQDSLILLPDLEFTTDLERNTFTFTTEKIGGNDALHLLLTFSQDTSDSNLNNIKHKIEKFVNKESANIQGKSKDKAMKSLYNSVHQTFFKKYANNCDFNEIFENGIYNCLTATALYSIVFEKLNIPYVIKEKPTHAYLIAYPDTERILFETTDPQRGYLVLNEAFQKEFLGALVKSKMISEEEYKNQSTSVLFNKYYFTDEDISLKELISLHYYNHCVKQIQEKNFSESLINLKKAYFLYPCPRNYFLLKNTLINNVASGKYKSEEDIKQAVILSKFFSDGKSVDEKEQVINIFKTITENQLITSGDFNLYKKSYESMLQILTDQYLSDEIKFLYNYHVAWVHLIKGNYTGTDENLVIAHTIHPENIYLQNAVYENIRLKCNNISDPKRILEILNKMSKTFPFLTTSANILNFKSSSLLALADQSYQKNDISNGDLVLNEFSKIKGEFPDLEVNENFVERAYLSAGSAYFRKGNTTKAKERFKEGLQWVPDSFELKQRLKQINGY